MAKLAGLREAGRRVIRIRRSLEILPVAPRTIGRRSLEDVVDVALLARHCRVRAGERESSDAVVIERSAFPLRGVMAKNTIL